MTGPVGDEDERTYLAAYEAIHYVRPSVTVDVVLLTVRDGSLWTLLGRREDHPAKGDWALPGGFVRIDEALDDAAARVLRDKAGLDDVFTEQLYTFGAPDRDPRTRVISVAYYALVEPATLDRAVGTAHDERLWIARLDPGGAADDTSIRVHDGDGRPLALAFDHTAILTSAVRRVRGKLDYAPLGFEFLPVAFSLRDLRLVHEAILARPLNKDSFRRRIIDRGLVVPTGHRASGLGHRPPELYRFAQPSGASTRS